MRCPFSCQRYLIRVPEILRGWGGGGGGREEGGWGRDWGTEGRLWDVMERDTVGRFDIWENGQERGVGPVGELEEIFDVMR